MRYRRRMLWSLLTVATAVGAWTVIASILVHQLPDRARNTVIIAFVVLMALAMRGVAHKVARPIERMTEATRRFGSGELSYRLPEPPPWTHRFRHHRRRRRHGFDEIVELGRSWNEMAERIERLVRGQKELLASVSHDLRSPLARVRVALELLPRNGDAGAERTFAEIESDLHELDRMIDDILTASRLDAADAPARIERVSVPGLVEDVVRKARTLGAEVHSSTAFDGEVDADGTLLRRALGNLVENAVKHGAPPVTVSAEREGNELRLRVSDGGPGIPAEDRERLLQPFARGDRARTPRRDGGVGLGLTIARRVAEVHGGRLVIEDAETETGSRIALYIPLTT